MRKGQSERGTVGEGQSERGTEREGDRVKEVKREVLINDVLIKKMSVISFHDHLMMNSSSS